MRKNLLLILVLIISTISFAQNPVEPTNFSERSKALKIRQQLAEKSITAEIPFRSIGPAVMSGRIVDLDVNPENPNHFYVAYASGGLWETRNNGQSFTPLFDKQSVMTIGDIAVDWQTGTLWLGSGENNSSRSSYSGDGIYKSTDNGKNWQHTGLGESHHIGRIIIDPENHEKIYVAVLGHLYSPNPERGIFVSEDGGKNWTKTLYVDENTGAIDLIINPLNNKELYAALWYRTRSAWNLEEAGKTSGIYRSTDGGKNWELISNADFGFPQGDGIGRIGLDISHQKPQKIYAFLDNQNHRPKIDIADKKESSLTKSDFKNMKSKVFLKLDNELLNNFLRDNNFPEKYTADKIKNMVEQGEIEPLALSDYLHDANAALFDTPIVGAEVYVSNVDKINWKRTHTDYLDDLVYTYGYYFGEIRVSPNDDQIIYVLGVPMLKSADGGATFKSVQANNVHADHHALWINPKNPAHLVNGNDGGLNISYDAGENWLKVNIPAVGQFYTVAIDDATPYNVYGGLQDNGVWYGPSTYKADVAWQQSGHYPYREIMGGDGMHVQVDTRDNNLVYTGFQFGWYYRYNKQTGQMQSIRPTHKLGEKPLRYNWQTPIWLSQHNQDVLYMGSNKFHRSLKKGEHMETLSGDLTKGSKTGDVAYGTLTSIHESPMRFGLLYVGSDDGLVHVSKDGGYNWKNISNGLPENLWVTRVWASAHQLSRIYVALNGYRWDDFTPYIFVSDDYGKTWKNISANLPPEPINVVKEDSQNENVLYVGSDHALYISLDGGKSYSLLTNSMPYAPVHDLVVQETASELVVATHGRSIYAGSIKELRLLNTEILGKELYAFEISPVNHNPNWGNSWSKWLETNKPQVYIPVYCKSAGNIEATIRYKNLVLNKLEHKAHAGLNYITYNMEILSENVKQLESLLKTEKEAIKIEAASHKQYYLPKGEFTVEIVLKNQKTEQKLLIK